MERACNGTVLLIIVLGMSNVIHGQAHVAVEY